MANFKHEICTLDYCGRKHKARGLCNPHYMEGLRNLDFETKKWVKPVIERKRPRREPKPGQAIETFEKIDMNDFWSFIKKEMQL